MNVLTQKGKFDIRNSLDRLTPANGKNRYYCPVCENDNLTVDEGTGKYQCWNGCTCSDIREAISPWSEAMESQRIRATQSFTPIPRLPAKKPAPLPSKLELARLSTPVTDVPQPQQRTDNKRGQVQVTTYRYSDTQWVERVQWSDAAKPKGYDKKFYHWHLSTDGRRVCQKGEGDWLPYRWQEAIAAASESAANALLVVEGEGCVEAYRAIGFAAVTLLGSAWGTTDLTSFAETVKAHGLTIVFHPDFDSPTGTLRERTGEQKAQKLQQACDLTGTPCLILNPLNLCADLPPAGDVVDLLKMMDTNEYIKRLEAELHAAASRQAEAPAANSSAPPPPNMNSLNVCYR
jgi:putative DNA primase/helicase